MSDTQRTVELLRRYQAGEAAVGDELLERVYSELHALARSVFRREGPGHTLQPTALVHDAFVRLSLTPLDFESRKHFLGLAAKCMRRILREHARAGDAHKRGGAWKRVTLIDIGADGTGTLDCDVEALDAALEKLSRLKERQARVVELRFFAELSIEETAEALGVSHGTVENDWRFARAWLLRELSS